MGRRKKPEAWLGVEWFLVHEDDIRAAVADRRKELSFISTSWAGSGGGGKAIRADRTGDLVVKRSKKIPVVVLSSTGDTVDSPEEWLAVFDTVRKKAKGEPRAAWIEDFWRIRYANGGGRCVCEIITGGLDREIDGDREIMWIIENVEAEAVKRGLLEKEDCLLYGRDVRFLHTCKPRRLD